MQALTIGFIKEGIFKFTLNCREDVCLLRYAGSRPLKAFNVRRRILNSILDFTGSQYREASNGEMCSLI